ncbi:sugar phosphate exchanger 2-like protein [Sarcoptes scabiei]|uniref:Sugar phosphate exchanger 3 n=1 Tax=Sarcoptes scabiei TaxID=52283 RepID=A0A132ABS5_SARSC|nr:sugar phosphate exchanger 2-like protein [Sarcoptes scabiei]
MFRKEMLRLNEKIVPFLICARDPNRQLLCHRLLILFITFLVYTTYHTSRKPMSVVKSKLYLNETSTENWYPFEGHNGRSLLSLLDAVYWGSYAIFMFITGFLCERSDLRLFLSISLTLCGILCIMQGFAFTFNIHSLSYFVVMQLLNGAMQTTGWPTVIAIVGGWFSDSKRGLIFGIWNFHTSLGNILGLTIAGIFVDYNWGLSFQVPGFLCILVGLIVFLFVVPRPSDIGIHLNRLSKSNLYDIDKSKNEENKLLSKKRQDAISFWNALRIPGVIEYSVCLAFTKSVSYIFLNWLPKFLEESFSMEPSESAYISIMFEIGGMIGSIVAGLLADRTEASGLFSSISMTMNFILQLITGFFVNGPYSLITTAVSADLAEKVPSKNAMATVSAIIDGTGSIGAALGPAITGPLTDLFGWQGVFYLSMLADLIAILCLVRIGLEEMRKIFLLSPSR